MSSVPQENEVKDVNAFGEDDIFNKETVPSSQSPSNVDDTPKLSPEEIEKYDRLIQVCSFGCFFLFSLGSAR